MVTLDDIFNLLWLLGLLFALQGGAARGGQR